MARAEGKKNVAERLDLSKLQSEEIRRKSNIEVTNRFGALEDIDDPKKEYDMILATEEMEQTKSWGGQRNFVGHGQEAKHRKNQGEKRGKIGIGGRKIGRTERQKERGV